MSTSDTQTATAVYQLKISLRHIRPPIWRRVLVTNDTLLNELHHLIQAAMPWYGGHLYCFNINGQEYAEPNEFNTAEPKNLNELEDMFGDLGGLFREPPTFDDRVYRLCDVIPDVKFKFYYVYDFGDDWQHEILVEKILDVEPDTVYPRCIKAKRATPPEDCGGPWGYAELRDRLQSGNFEDIEDEWSSFIDPDFDPEACDLDEVNDRIRQRWQRRLGYP